MRSALLSIPNRKSVEFSLDESWDTFGGEETRMPWAEAAIEDPKDAIRLANHHRGLSDGHPRFV